MGRRFQMAIVRNTKRDDAVPRAVFPQNCNQTYYIDVRKDESYGDRGITNESLAVDFGGNIAGDDLGSQKDKRKLQKCERTTTH